MSRIEINVSDASMWRLEQKAAEHGIGLGTLIANALSVYPALLDIQEAGEDILVGHGTDVKYKLVIPPKEISDKDGGNA